MIVRRTKVYARKSQPAFLFSQPVSHTATTFNPVLTILRSSLFNFAVSNTWIWRTSPNGMKARRFARQNRASTKAWRMYSTLRLFFVKFFPRFRQLLKMGRARKNNLVPILTILEYRIRNFVECKDQYLRARVRESENFNIQSVFLITPNCDSILITIFLSSTKLNWSIVRQM